MSKIDKKWTKAEFEQHIKTNVTEYGAAIVVGALFKKLYGQHPSIGLSGFQAEAIDSVVDLLPNEVSDE